MNEIDWVAYNSHTGIILPELQWFEGVTITSMQVILTRKGIAEINHINAGSWEIPVKTSAVTALFDQLKMIDCRGMKRIELLEPLDSPDDEDTEIYVIHYKNGNQCSLLYDPGTSYEHGDLVRKPIKEFIQSLTIPQMAVSRYLER